MRKFMFRVMILCFFGYIAYKNRFRIVNGILGFQAIRHFVMSRLNGGFLLDRFIFSDKSI